MKLGTGLDEVGHPHPLALASPFTLVGGGDDGVDGRAESGSVQGGGGVGGDDLGSLSLDGHRRRPGRTPSPRPRSKWRRRGQPAATASNDRRSLVFPVAQ